MKEKRLKTILEVVICISLLLIASLISSILMRIEVLRRTLRILRKDDCTDKISFYIIDEVSAKLNNVNKIYISIIIVISASIVVKIINYCLRFKGKLKPSSPTKRSHSSQYELAQTSF
jgi:hypothetical protein